MLDSLRNFKLKLDVKKLVKKYQAESWATWTSKLYKPDNSRAVFIFHIKAVRAVKKCTLPEAVKIVNTVFGLKY